MFQKKKGPFSLEGRKAKVYPKIENYQKIHIPPAFYLFPHFKKYDIPQLPSISLTPSISATSNSIHICCPHPHPYPSLHPYLPLVGNHQLPPKSYRSCKNFHNSKHYLVFKLSSVFSKKNLGSIKHVFEQILFMWHFSYL